MLQRGLFPETLPPCFTSVDLKRAFSGLVRRLHLHTFHQKRQSDYIRYSGTKHDGSRRYYGTPNPISYFYVADFIASHWQEFETRFKASPFSVSQPKVGEEHDDRAIIMQSLSELTATASRKLAFAGYILKTDIAQFFPSLYTHAISWSAHSIEVAKRDTASKSDANYFNRLDLFVRNCQRNESRGLIIGPDAFRIIAEYIMAGLDIELQAAFSATTVGTARHVDDYYVGVVGQPEALAAQSILRDTLQRYSLNINDAKTKVMSGLEPLNELWAQEFRYDKRELLRKRHSLIADDLVLFLNRALALAGTLTSASPIKIALRTFDEIGVYESAHWEILEPYLQRIMAHYPHAIDYTALLVVKRFARKASIDNNGWQAVAYSLIKRHLALNHHHEVAWLLWLLFSTAIEVTDQLASECAHNENAHLRAMMVAAFTKGKLRTRPPIHLGSPLASTGDDWLLRA